VTRTFDDLAFIGIAPEADIATGCINLTGNSPILNPADPTSASALKAFSEIFNFADAQQKPCVINFSAGISQTMANNRQLEEEAIRTMLQKPGHVMVVAAGNQGWYHYLMHKEAAMQQAGAGVRFHQEDVYGAYLGVELKMKPDQTLRIRYTNDKYTANHAEATLKASEVTGTKPFVLGSTGIYRKNLTATLTEKTGDGYVIIYLSCDDSTFPDTDRLLLTIEGDGEAWMYADTSCAPLEDVAGVDNHNITTDGYTVAWPGSMPEVITVGNIGWRYVLYGTYGVGWDLTDYERGKGEGYLARSSSCGPTLTGLTKPDVCAPGVNVISALSNGLGDGLGYEAQAALDAQLQYQWMGFCDEESDDYHMMLTETGTSMSAPAVAGTVALWLQADPTLTTEDIKTLLAQTSRQPDSDLTYPNNQYGHGEVDAYKGLLQLLGLSTGIDAISSHQPRLTQIRLDGRCLQLAMEEGADEPFTVSIYATDGRLLLHADSQQRIDLSRLPTGIYAVQVSTGRASTTGSTLIRIGN
jgi:subtilisin family serine protease